MKRVIERLRAFQYGPALGIAVIATAVAVAFDHGHRPPAARPVAFDPVAHAAASPESTAAFVSHLVGTLQDASVHHVTAMNGVKPHFHRNHDEVVVILEGQGTLRIGEESHALGPGRTFLVPRGTVHSVDSTGTALRAISVFVPPFDGRDRIFTER